jgi:hypothetical protein
MKNFLAILGSILISFTIIVVVFSLGAVGINELFQEFNCSILQSSQNVSSVHELRVSDLKAVAALGDSLTAGIKLKLYFQFLIVFTNHRYWSGCIVNTWYYK